MVKHLRVVVLLMACIVEPVWASMSENITDKDVAKLKVVIGQHALGEIQYIDGIYDKCPCGELPLCEGAAKVALELRDKVRVYDFVTLKGEWKLSEIDLWGIKYRKLFTRYLEERKKPEKNRAELNRLMKSMRAMDETRPSCDKAKQQRKQARQFKPSGVSKESKQSD